MNIRYTLEDKPDFFDGELVDVDMSEFGLPPEILTGKIVGKASTNIVDNWLVEFPRAFPPSYPYQVVSTPHTFILKN
jgi:hypothetical protein